MVLVEASDLLPVNTHRVPSAGVTRADIPPSTSIWPALGSPKQTPAGCLASSSGVALATILALGTLLRPCLLLVIHATAKRIFKHAQGGSHGAIQARTPETELALAPPSKIALKDSACKWCFRTATESPQPSSSRSFTFSLPLSAGISKGLKPTSLSSQAERTQKAARLMTSGEAELN
eukprot:scaffold294810_cov14-Prasinocladus_malaysianus.AAC.1